LFKCRAGIRGLLASAALGAGVLISPFALNMAGAVNLANIDRAAPLGAIVKSTSSNSYLFSLGNGRAIVLDGEAARLDGARGRQMRIGRRPLLRRVRDDLAGRIKIMRRKKNVRW